VSTPSTPSHHEHLPVIGKFRSSSDPAIAVTRTTLTCSSSSTHHSAATDFWSPSPHRFPSMLCTTEPPHGQPPPAAVQCRLLILELCSNSVVLTDYRAGVLCLCYGLPPARSTTPTAAPWVALYVELPSAQDPKIVPSHHRRTPHRFPASPRRWFARSSRRRNHRAPWVP
jgi:hypothetical protein